MGPKDSLDWFEKIISEEYEVSLAPRMGPSKDDAKEKKRGTSRDGRGSSPRPAGSRTTLKDVCQNFLRGKCTKGKDCKRWHNKTCKHFAAGQTCPLGSFAEGGKCPFPHFQLPMAAANVVSPKAAGASPKPK